MPNLCCRHLHYNITLNISTRFGPQGVIINESNQSNRAQNQISHFLYSRRGVQWNQMVKSGRLFVKLYTRGVYVYTGSWKRPGYLTKVSTVPCGPEIVGILLVILQYNYLRNNLCIFLFSVL